MKKTVLALVVAAATGVALSAQAPAKTPSSAPAAKHAAKAAPAQAAPAAKEASTMKSPAKAKAKVETAEVVSTDATAKSITVKPASGENETYTATGGAVAQLDKVKAGDHVRLTVHNNDVTRITMAPAKHSGMKKGTAKKESEKKEPAK